MMMNNILNENIISRYNKWKEGYIRKENSIEIKIKNWIDAQSDSKKYSISKDGKHVNCSGSIVIRDSDLVGGKFPVPFGKVKGVFNCGGCKTLVSLKGAPTKCLRFICSNCANLTSLEGLEMDATECIKFDCSYCSKLTSLKGAPIKIGGYFGCNACTSLSSLEGAPRTVMGSFSCENCTSLTSLKGGPRFVKGFEYKCSDTNITSFEGIPKQSTGIITAKIGRAHV